jgi:hypothetical protein
MVILFPVVTLYANRQYFRASCYLPCRKRSSADSALHAVSVLTRHGRKVAGRNLEGSVNGRMWNLTYLIGWEHRQGAGLLGRDAARGCTSLLSNLTRSGVV